MMTCRRLYNVAGQAKIVETINRRGSNKIAHNESAILGSYSCLIGVCSSLLAQED